MKNIKTKKSASLNSRLAAYSVTAAAAVLAAPDAHAAVKNLTAGTVTVSALNFGLASTTVNFGSFGSFHVNLSANHNTGGGQRSQTVNIGVAGKIFGTGFAANFAGGAAIAGPHPESNNRLAIRTSGGFGSFAYGHFLPAASGAKTGYVGFKTQQHAQTYYGWLRVKVTADGGDYPSSVSLVSSGGIVGAYGLGTDGITAGELAPTPEPGTVAIGGLGLLALGARGIRELRRRREATSLNQNN